MSDWVHCNNCYCMPGAGNTRKFFLTSCGHVFCEACVPQGKPSQCSICKNACTTIPLLGTQMKPEVEKYFKSTTDLWKKAAKAINDIIPIAEFQKNHRMRLAAYNSAKNAKDQGLIEQCKKLSRENEHLREENHYLKKAGGGKELGQLQREIMVLREENAYLKKYINSKEGQWKRLSPRGSRQSPVQAPHGASSISQRMSPQQTTSHTGDSTISCIGPGRLRIKSPPVKTPPVKTSVAKSSPANDSPRFITSGTVSRSSPMLCQREGSFTSLMGHRGRPGSSPMVTSPREGILAGQSSQTPHHGAHGHCQTTHASREPSLPPTCMPITPNRPNTPGYSSVSMSTAQSGHQHQIGLPVPPTAMPITPHHLTNGQIHGSHQMTATSGVSSSSQRLMIQITNSRTSFNM